MVHAGEGRPERRRREKAETGREDGEKGGELVSAMAMAMSVGVGIMMVVAVELVAWCGDGDGSMSRI